MADPQPPPFAAAAAVLAGARSATAIAEWAADAPQPVRAALGARRDAPDHFTVPAEATIRRTLARLDADALAAAIGAWLAGRDPDRDCAGTGRRRAVAVDGKTLRGARGPAGDGRSVHLLAAMDHATRAVLAQQQVGGAPEEVPAFARCCTPATRPAPGHPRHHPREQPPMNKRHGRAPEPWLPS